jgi:hypothetical protein
MRVADTAIDVQFLDQNQISISWSGINGYVSWVYINGIYLNAFTLTGTSKTTNATADLTKPVRVEIHELPVGVTQQHPCETPDEDNPWVYWQPVVNALRYTIYGRHQDDGSTRRLKAVNNNPLVTYYQERVTMDMKRDGGCFWWMNVKTTSIYSIDSTSTITWPYFTMGLPPIPTGATMMRVGSGPSSTLTLTLQV